jgi:hypothetical protein
LAKKELTTVQYGEWQQRYNIAATSLEQREEKMAELQSELERDMVRGWWGRFMLTKIICLSACIILYYII